MIALGIAPGLHALAYSVLRYNGGPRAELIDADTLHAGRGAAPRNASEIERRSRAHRLVLDVVFDRNPPTVIVLAPQAEDGEPPEHVAVVRLAVMALGSGFGVTILDLGDPLMLYAALGIKGQRDLSVCLRGAVTGPGAVPRDRRILFAQAAAVAATRRDWPG